MTCRQVAISPRVRRFSHADACRIFDSALDQRGSSLVLIDMSEIDEATTSAFARLVLLRRMLIREGRDMRLTGLRDRAAMLYEISRLQSVLPCC